MSENPDGTALASYQKWKQLRIGAVGPTEWDQGLMFLFHPYMRHENNLTREQLRHLAGTNVSMGDVPEFQPTMGDMLKLLETFVGQVDHTPVFSTATRATRARSGCKWKR